MNVLLRNVWVEGSVCERDREGFCILSMCVCVLPPETDWIRSKENRAACARHNWIKEAIDANQTSIPNQWRINAKQLAAAPHDVFKPRLAVRQTGSERLTFHCQRQTKGNFPPHLQREWAWLKVQTEFGTCHSMKVCLLKAQVPLRGRLSPASVSVEGFMFQCLCIIGRCFCNVCVHWLGRRASQRNESTHIFTCTRMHACVDTICILFMIVVVSCGYNGLFETSRGCFHITTINWFCGNKRVKLRIITSYFHSLVVKLDRARNKRLLCCINYTGHWSAATLKPLMGELNNID